MSIDQGRHSLGVDFGTSNTVAVARWPDGRARPILVDGSPLLPSAVYAEAEGHLIVGRDAVHSARRDPGRFEPNPKRRIDDGTVLLGEQEFAVVDMIAAVLVRIADEWHRAVGPVRPELTLTCPATWGATRRGLLAEAAARVGLTRARLVAEPVAAATYFAEVLGRDVPIGSVVVVHDFGAGTFDVSVVARTAEGFEVLAVDGRDDLGGLDIDAALVRHIGKLCAERDAASWQRLTEPATLEDRRAQRQLWDDVRIAKERLSRLQSADVMVPLLDLELHVTREELEELARPILDQTVRVTHDLLRWADLADGRLAGVFLVGGASRIPLVATLLHRALGAAPVAIEQPELVVAEGSILAGAALLATEPAAPGPTTEMRLLSRLQAAPAGVPAAARSEPVGEQTVRSSREPSRGAPGLPPPAVDPWPDAQQHWAPDPDQTVLSDSSWEPQAALRTPPPAPAPPVSPAVPRFASGPAAARQGSAPGARAASGSATPRPVSPSGARSASGSVASRPVSPPRARSATGSATPQPVSPAGSRSASGSVASRPVPPPRPVADKQPGSAAGWPEPPPAQRAARKRRRAGGLLRFIQMFLSVLILVAAPLAAMVAAYCVIAGVSYAEAVDLILDDVRRLLERV